jgi:RNA polymerase Rpb1, domain 4
MSGVSASLGQQSVGGSRIQDGFVNRTLPHFPVGSLSSAAKDLLLTPSTPVRLVWLWYMYGKVGMGVVMGIYMGGMGMVMNINMSGIGYGICMVWLVWVVWVC